jgi:hypothetical protein
MDLNVLVADVGRGCQAERAVGSLLGGQAGDLPRADQDGLAHAGLCEEEVLSSQDGGDQAALEVEGLGSLLDGIEQAVIDLVGSLTQRGRDRARSAEIRLGRELGELVEQGRRYGSSRMEAEADEEQIVSPAAGGAPGRGLGESPRR